MCHREQHALNCAKRATMENTDTNGGGIFVMQKPTLYTYSILAAVLLKGGLTKKAARVLDARLAFA